MTDRNQASTGLSQEVVCTSTLGSHKIMPPPQQVYSNAQVLPTLQQRQNDGIRRGVTSVIATQGLPPPQNIHVNVTGTETMAMATSPAASQVTVPYHVPTYAPPT